MPAPRIVPRAIRRQMVRRYKAGEPVATLGSAWGYDYKTTRRILVDEGVNIRICGGRRKPPPAPIKQLLAWHQAGESCRQIALRLGTYPNKVAHALRDAGHEPLDGRTRRGHANPISKPRRRPSKEGYISTIVDPSEYHLCSGRNGHGSRSMLEHRLVMARHLGRPLYDYEVVHHKNGRRDDNRLSNLELWETGQPPGQRTGECAPRKHCPTCTCC